MSYKANLHQLHIDYLSKQGWQVIEQNPNLMLKYLDGSFASGLAAEYVLKVIGLPKIYATWTHPDLDLTCEYVDLPPYSYVQKGDFWIVNGAWYGRREEKGFRVLATGTLIECDNSKWVKTEYLDKSKSNYFGDDDIPL